MLVRRSSRSLLLLLALALLAHGCGGDETGMPDGGPDDGSLDASPDGADADAGPTSCMSVTTITGASVTGPFPDGIAGDTDLAVENGLVRVVFNAVDHDPELAASGGNIVDFHFLGEDDHFRELSQLASPGQAFQVRYTALEVATETLDTVIVRATGHVSPQPDEGGFPLTPDPGAGLAVVTEYELRCGDPRVRLSTTITNTTANVYAVSNGFSVMDFLVWGGRSAYPFCPDQGQGDACTAFDAGNPLATLVRTPYVGSTGSVIGSPASFAYYPVSVMELMGVHDPQLSAMGNFSFGLGLFMPAETKSYERVLVAGHAADVASAVDLVLEDLAALGRMQIGTVSGSVSLPAGESLSADPHQRPLIVLATPEAGADPIDPALWTPATIVRVREDGSFSARMPAGDVSWELRHAGHQTTRGAAAGTLAAEGTLDLGTLAVPEAALLDISVTDGTAGLPSRVVVFGADTTPTPSFGSRFGGSPAGNMALTDGDGSVSLSLPPGTYDVYATRGMRYSLALQRLVVPAAGLTASFTLTELDVVPPEFIAGDFHVHSAASFDSSLPIEDRVLAYLAEGMHAIVSTEHDVIFDYGPALAALEATLPPRWRGQLRSFVGVESTGFVPYADFVHTIGHHNAFPLTPQPGAYRNGAPPNEFMSPGELYELLRAADGPAERVIQVNHGRWTRVGAIWLGYFDSCGFDPTLPFDATHPCFSLPGPAGTRAWDFDAIEILGTTDGYVHFINSQRDWFAMLRMAPSGLPVATANSDSHYLPGGEAGYPQTFLKTGGDLSMLDDAGLVAALTSGAVAAGSGVHVWIEVCQADGTGCVEPGRTPITVASGADLQMNLRVAAPPWVPVDEIRVRLGGEVVQRIDVSAMTPADPLGTTGTIRFEGPVMLAGITADTFVTVDAGFVLPRVGDLDGDGAADTTDNNGDGIVDDADAAIGGLLIPDPPPFMNALSANARALGFVNPVLIDADGNGAYDAIGTPLVD